ncbi:hypothetical protein [Streptomyces sp. Tu102]|uniref:hypothetical protein n=1 Tax=Streptomyces sp. Tu102 TaxID=2838019 RepID=UPI001BDDA6A5|nr:hypothetical protein [Streptomyces sp. Tu102]MBT1093188.1 hypothetical protein [Streptomyces sp. Tu102]
MTRTVERRAAQSPMASWLQLTPFTQFSGRPRLDEGVHEGPCATDIQREAAAERSQVIHDRDLDHGIRRDCVASDKQERPLSVIEQMEDCLITPKTERQQGKLTAREPDFKVPLATGAQSVEVLR